MELAAFFAGVILTLAVGFIVIRYLDTQKRRKAREAYIPPQGSGLDRPIKDFDPDRHEK